MKIFLTGGTGFIGGYFLKQALDAGHHVTAIRFPGEQAKCRLDRQPEWLDGSLADDWHVALSGCEALVHLAAVGVSPQIADLTKLFDVNVSQSLALWVQALDAGVRRLVISGSCFEYGRSAERYERIPADAPLEPTNPYAASKAAATMAAMALCAERKAEVLLLRPFHVFGEGQHGANFWPSMRKAALEGRDFEMTTGEQVRDFVAVEEVASAFLHGLTRTDVQPGVPVVENIGTGHPQTLRAFAGHWWKTWGAKGRLLFGAVPYREGEIMRYVPEIQERVQTK